MPAGEMVQTRIKGDLQRQFNRFLKEHGTFSRSSVVKAALNKFFYDDKELAAIFKGLNRYNNHLDRIDERLNVLSEAFLLFLRFYFAVAPETEPQAKEQVELKSAVSYARFFELLKEQLREGDIESLFQEKRVANE